MNIDGTGSSTEFAYSHPLFAIDVCAYAVMSNHYHLVLKVCPEQLVDLSEEDIMDRWCALFKGPF